MIEELDYVSVPVEDMSDAVRFYRDVIGLHFRYELPGLLGRICRGPDAPRALSEGARRGPWGDVAFRVDNLDREISRLEALCVVFPHGIEAFEVPEEKGTLARFRDPSGNHLELVERA